MTQTCDTVLDVCNSFGYDEFDRLTARTVTQGTVQNFTYGYDRYGNRWTQNAPQGGPSLSISFNQGNNIISTSGFANDVVGNVANDTFHGYSYDADGNLISVDSGATATYYYDSLNQRVRIAPTRGTYEFVCDIFGRRVSNWAAASHGFVESNAYTDSAPIAFRIGGQTDFEHQNWLGTERVRTTYNGAVAISIASLPWADDHTPSGDNGDQHDFALMDRDLEDNSEHAQYRQFSTNVGRWMSPDFYMGSYDFTNPQSLNRYSYSLNDPANLLDPSGLDAGGPDCDADDTVCVNGGGYGGGVVVGIPSSCLTPIGCIGLPITPKPPIEPPTAPSNPCAHSALTRRIATGIQGAANIGIAGSKIAGVGAADILLVGGGAAGTVFTGGASDIAAGLAAGALTTYGVTSASGQAVSGFGQLYTAITGNSEAGEAIGQGGDILGGPMMGIGTLVAGGSAATAQQNAQLEGVATAGNAFVGSKGTSEFLMSAADLTLSVLGMGGGGCH